MLKLLGKINGYKTTATNRRFGGISYINQGYMGVLERLGKFVGTKNPGLVLYMPFITKVINVEMRYQQWKVPLTVRTSENVTVEVSIAIQCAVNPEKIREALYNLKEPHTQITTQVENSVKSITSGLSLENLYKQQTDITEKVKEGVRNYVETNGYLLGNVVIDKIVLPRSVVDAMNSVYESTNNLNATINDAKAEYEKSIRESLAEKERKRLQGEGIAEQRKAIAEGLRDCIRILANTGISAAAATELVQMTQSLDTLAQMATSPGSKVVFVPNDLRITTQQALESQQVAASPI